MESAQEYFLRMHNSLANNYRTPDGFFSESCAYISFEMARRLLAENKEPAIYWVGRMLAERELDRPMLEPARYSGKVRWACHIFAGVEDIIWDPILPTPVSIADYPQLVFNNRCSDVRIKVPNSEIRDFLQR
ncbi:Uncharacterised protein [uncultured archaeon]|nr:Uncharacterised protein [uncultured archaeon]